MPNTFVKISTTTVGSGGAATIDFNSIPQTYTDLMIKASTRSSAAGGAGSHALYFSTNGVITNRSGKLLYSTGATISFASYTTPYGGAVPGSTTTASYFSNNEIYLNNYAGSNYKTYVAEYFSPSADANYESGLFIGLWSASTAISSLSLYPSTGSFVQYSTATLYGIKSS